MTLLSSPISGFSEATSRAVLVGWLTKDTQTVELGVLRSPRYIMRVHIHCTQAFNSDGTDNITVGYTGTTNAYATATDVATTGVKSVTLGSGVGYDATNRTVTATYANGGTEPSTGKALVIVEYLRVPLSS